MLLLYPTDLLPPGELSDYDLRDLYRHRRPEGRPVRLRSNFVTSLDGSIQGADGRSGGLNTPSDQHVFALHRASCDAILVGAQTVRAEGYRAVDLAPWQRELRAAEGPGSFPLLAVVTRSLDLDPGLARNGDLEVGRVVVLTTTGKTTGQLAPFEASGVEVVQLGTETVDLAAAVEHLARLGCVRLLCEGGPRLHRDLLAADLVDEMSLTLAPVVVGGQGRRTTVGAALPAEPRFRLASAVVADDGALFLSYERERGGPASVG